MAPQPKPVSERLPPDVLSADERARLDAACAQSVERTLASWPELGVDEDQVLELIAARVVPEDWERSLQALDVPGLHLAQRALTGDGRAVKVMESLLTREAGKVWKRLGATEDELTELAQVLRIAFFGPPPGVASRLAYYSGRGSVRGWIRAVATRELASVRRTARPEPDRESALSLLPAGRDLELDYLKERYAAEFKQAFSVAVSALSSRERNLLRLSVVERLGIDAVATVYKVHRATAARWIAQARDVLEERTRNELTARLRLGAGEFDSLARLVQSQLDLSIERLLGT